jgi:23S rRNA (cytidine1920-2'-O)/16S rRNA (cytidine1409-2'-O)-methyltransferase
MPRLDLWLTQQGLVPSRQVAKRIIKDGHVTVDGRIGKPSTNVKGIEEILISKDASIYPIGYSKLKEIDRILGGHLVSSGQRALDIGSSAGGFIYYLSEKGAIVTGIEISQEFLPILREIERTNENVTIMEADAFTLQPIEICATKTLDILLIDVTTDLAGTIKLLERYLPLLKYNGTIISSFKSGNETDVKIHLEPLNTQLSNEQFIVLNPENQEIHLLAVRH